MRKLWVALSPPAPPPPLRFSWHIPHLSIEPSILITDYYFLSGKAKIESYNGAILSTDPIEEAVYH